MSGPDESGGTGKATWGVAWHARNYAMGGMIKQLLEEQGILVMLRPRLGVPHFGSSEPVVVLVPKPQVETAQELIEAFIGPGSGVSPSG